MVFVALGSTFVNAAALPGGTLDPTTVTKYVTPLVIPPAMPYTAGTNTDYYEIAVRQFQQQILPAGLPQTTVWSYGSTNPAGVFHFPAFTIEATHNRPIQVKWINDLTDGAGNCLPHLLPVDQTLHWANPIGPRDTRGTDNAPYTGPVPIVTHLHGGEINQESDGFPEAWYLPNCNMPANIKYREGTLYNTFKASSPVGNLWGPGNAVFTYPNTQRDATLWYHDHAMGMTRLNVYAGPAGFYNIRGDVNSQVTGTLPGPAPMPGDAGGPYYEIPLAVQDRSFNSDGSLFFPGDRAFFEGLTPAELQIPFIPAMTLNGTVSDVSPIWNPESFGNTMLVNGKTWPVLQVEQRRYRFRFLNGNLARFLILTTDTSNSHNNAMTPALTFWQIGAEGGYLPAPVPLTQILMGNAERADVIVDFTNIPVGTNINLLNIGPDEPFGGGIPYYGCLTDALAPAGCFEPADPATTGQVMQFQVVSAPTSTDFSTPPDQLVLPARTPLPAPSVTRYLSLNEQMSMTVCALGDPIAGTFNIPITEVACTDPNAVQFGPAEARLGTYDPIGGIPTHMEFMQRISENPTVGTTEVWEIWNFTADAHPIHIHQVQFEVLGRALQSDPTGVVGTSVAGSNAPMPWETGTKDTIIVYPGELARVKATFDVPGLSVWHCHIVDHEDNEMMRPSCTVDANGILSAACKVLNGKSNIGIYRNGKWVLDVNENMTRGGLADPVKTYGTAGDTPVAGDWNGDGSTDAGVFNAGNWTLDTNGNGVLEPGVDAQFVYGLAGDVPVKGDWNADGITDVGVFRGTNQWILDMNGNRIEDLGDAYYTFGLMNAVPVTGDWMGDGMTRIGIFQNGLWRLDMDGDGVWNKLIDKSYTFGTVGDIPVTGDWMGDRMGAKIGVFRGAGIWRLDANGTGLFELGMDIKTKYGIAGDLPVVGIW